ncbi:MAG TPA: DUF2252 domain-containing protein [Microlunatus sp.]|nr:DUF2252 domain-containing protein [Microlunatus sp.]
MIMDSGTAAGTREDRWRSGKALRRQVPLEALGALDRTEKTDPVALLESQAETRVPELVPVRYGRMLVSPFTFYRGAAKIMAADLAQSPRTPLTTQLCGDAHLSNFGVFASPERRLVFDLNDFDETHPGPFEWDVKRLLASLEIAGRFNAFSRKQRRSVVLAAARAYRLAIRDLATKTNLAVWYAHQAVQPGLPGLRTLRSKETRRAVRKTLDKAYSRDNLGSLRSLTETVDGRLRFVSNPPLVVPSRELDLPGAASVGLENWIAELLEQYRQTLSHDRRRLVEQYTFVDIARKVVGVGSVGTRAWIVLLRGVDDQDPLILQAKEATASVLEPHTEPSVFGSHGERVVQGQRLMQAYGDVLLGWQFWPDRPAPHYYVRQLRDWKGSMAVEGLDVEAVTTYAGYCAWTLARAHARSGDRLAIAGYLGSKDAFDTAMADYAGAYADVNERDFAALEAAAADGRIDVQRGV